MCNQAKAAIDQLLASMWQPYKETANFVYLRSPDQPVTCGVCKRTGQVCQYANVD